MPQPILLTGTAGLDLPASQPVKEPLGTPVSSTATHAEEGEGGLLTGVWECTPGRWRRQVLSREFSHFISGPFLLSRATHLITETVMPHVIVKMLEGRTQAQKEALTEEIAKALKTAIGCPDESISVAIEDFAPADWKGKVYDTDILGAGENLFRKPGYEP